MLKKLSRKQLHILRTFGGAGLLTGIFAIWIKSAGYGKANLLFSAVCALLAAAVYIRFAPLWVDFWHRDTARLYCSQPAEKDTPPYTYIKIFLSYMAVSRVVLGLIFLFRYSKGYVNNFGRSLSVWYETDGRHYIDIAREGYLKEGHWDRLVQLVFLPGYPLAVKAVAFFTGSYLTGAIALSVACFGLSGCVFYKLLRLDYSHEQAVRGVKFLALYPGSFFFSGAMSESLFLLCRLGCVYLVRTGRWLEGGIAGAYCSFTRSTGIILPVVLIMEYIHQYSIDLNTGKPDKNLFKKNLSVLRTTGGFGGYMIINYLVAANPLKFMEYQKVHWSQGFGWFFETVAYQLNYLLDCLPDDRVQLLGLWLPNLAAIFGALIIMAFAAKKLRPSYTAFFIAYFFIAIGATWLLSAPRYLAALFPLPVALVTLTENKKADYALSALCMVLNLCYLYAFALRWCVW